MLDKAIHPGAIAYAYVRHHVPTATHLGEAWRILRKLEDPTSPLGELFKILEEGILLPDPTPRSYDYYFEDHMLEFYMPVPEQRRLLRSFVAVVSQWSKSKKAEEGLFMDPLCSPSYSQPSLGEELFAPFAAPLLLTVSP